MDRCASPDYPVLRALQTLLERQIVELVQTEEAPGFTGAGEGNLLDAAQLERLRERIGADAAVRQGLPAGKLLVTATEPGALWDFARLVGRLPGATLAPSLLTGRPDFERLGPIAEIGFEGGLRI